MLENREEETVRKWLQARPYIQLVSRDRSRTFRQAIQRTDASIIQVSDRFHLVQNLGSLLERILMRELPAKVKWEASTILFDPPDPAYMGIQEKNRQKNAQKKWKVIQEVQKLRRHGMPYSRIARRLHLSRHTVKKYESMNGPPDTRRKRRNRLIDPYLPALKEQTANGHTVTGIENSLREKGYTGSRSAIRSHVEEIRRKARRKTDSEKSITRRQAWSLFWKHHVELTAEERSNLNKVLSLYPGIKETYGFIQLFRDMIQHRDERILFYLFQSNETFKRREIRLFIEKLKGEKVAIQAALLYPYSNGLLEGHINRVKVIKRQLYGRASVELLKRRVLYRK